MQRQHSEPKLHVRTGGLGRSGEVILLLHGLGATGEAWRSFVERIESWEGRWIAPDLRGHGKSCRGHQYGIGNQAGDVAALVNPAERVTVIGHSAGGAVALALASGWFGFLPARVFALGIKTEWSDAELAKVGERAAIPVRHFATQLEAEERFLKVSGLAGRIAPGTPSAASGVVETKLGFSLAADPATVLVGAPPMEALFAAAACPIHLACGEHDPMVKIEQLAAYDPDARVLADVGHNAMVEDPMSIWNWIGVFDRELKTVCCGSHVATPELTRQA